MFIIKSLLNFVKDKNSGSVNEVKETHQMCYLFKPEVTLLLNSF